MANKSGAWGVESVKFAPLVDSPTSSKSPFPTTWTEFAMKAIVKDSLQFNDNAPSTNNIEIEDSDNYYATLQSDAGTEGFTIQTYDLSDAAAQFFLGYTKTSDGYVVETPKFKLQNHAVQITTKATDEFPQKTFEWANMKITVTKSGTIGKSGFPNINIECLKQAVFDDEGNELGSARWKTAATATASSTGHDHSKLSASNS